MKIFKGLLILVILSIAITFSTNQSYAGPAVKLFDTRGVPRGLKIAIDGSQDVNLQDQTTPPFDIRLHQIIKSELTLNNPTIPNSYSFTLTTGHGVVDTDSIAIIEEELDGTNHIFFGGIISISTDIIVVDSPIPFTFTISATVFTYSTAMNVNGATTTQVFNITNFFSTSVDVTRFIFHITDDVVMDDAKFGGLSALTRGILLRKKMNGSYINYWNVKSNGEFGELAYDKTYDPKAPAGVYGLSCRLTYAGQAKHGVVIRLDPGESIQLLIQDDLTGLSSFVTMVQGHFTQD